MAGDTEIYVEANRCNSADRPRAVLDAVQGSESLGHENLAN